MAAAGTPWYRNPSWWQWAGILALVTIFVLVLVISFGIIIPKRLAAKEPEKWGYHMLPVVLFFAGGIPAPDTPDYVDFFPGA